MYNGSNCDQKSQLSEILTESLNLRERVNVILVLSGPIYFSENSRIRVQTLNINAILLS